MTNLEKNTFFDINKLPPEKGLLVFGLSMNKLTNRHNATHVLNDIRIFSPDKISKPLVGVNFVYSDFLYLYTNKTAPELKNTLMHQVINHKNGMDKLIEKSRLEFQIQHAFNFLTWSQMYIGAKDFDNLFKKLKEIYQGDTLFQKYIEEDCEFYGREMEGNQVNFFLEEILMMYLITKGKIKLPNEYIENQQKWVLFCYTSKPLKSIVYLYQLNPFKLDWPENPYQNTHYYLEGKQLIEFDRVDLETYKLK